MENILKPGDLVIVKPQKELQSAWDRGEKPGVISSMFELCDTICTVRTVYDSLGFVTLWEDGGNWLWNPNWLVHQDEVSEAFSPPDLDDFF